MVSIDIKINGVDYENIFPDDFGGSTFEKSKESDAASKVVIQNERLFINPGHGKYFNGKAWVYQRPTPYAGTTAVYEDMVNPQFAAILGRVIPARSESAVEVFYTRDIENSSIDPKSHLPWKDLAS